MKIQFASVFSIFLLVFCSNVFSESLVNNNGSAYRVGPPLFVSTSVKNGYSTSSNCGSVFCLNRESCDSGRRICPVYRVRQDSCEKGEETVEMKFCNGPF